MSREITKEQGDTLLALARKTLEEKLDNGDPAAGSADPRLLESGATFVTLKIKDKLRGCIGTLEPVYSLWEGVRQNTLSAAFHDHRFSPLTRDELKKVRLDISVLTQPQELEFSDATELVQKLRPHIDGVILKYEGRGATFLPQVWKQLPEPENFLANLSMKAGLPHDSWKKEGVKIQTYQVQYFKEGK